jgi:hypothetical protein
MGQHELYRVEYMAIKRSKNNLVSSEQYLLIYIHNMEKKQWVKQAYGV